MKRHKKNNYTPGDILDMLHQQPAKRTSTRNPYCVPEHHACPHCGERRKMYIIHLRSNFKECETCGQTFVVEEYLKLKELHKHEDTD